MTRPGKELRELAKGLAFLSPWLAGFVLFTAVPVGLSLYYGFCDYPLLRPPVAIGAANYKALASDPTFWAVVRNTALYAVLALPPGTALAIGAAVLLNAKVRGQAVYRTLIFLPSLVPAVASAMLWLWMFNAKLGLVNQLLARAGVTRPPNWLGDTRWAMPSLVLISFWGLGNSVVIYLAGLQDVPRELYEASELDGASPARQLWHVTLPGISPVIFFNVVMGLIGTLQVLTLPYILTQGGPSHSTYFYTMYIYDDAFKYLKMGHASALGWVQLLVVLVLTGIIAYSSKHWVHHAGK